MQTLLRRSFALVLVLALAISLGTVAFAAKYGDVNSDGTVNGKDITILRRYLAGGYGETIPEKYGDVNGDNDVNGKDITILRRYLAGGYGVTLPADDITPATPSPGDNSTPWIPIP